MSDQEGRAPPAQLGRLGRNETPTAVQVLGEEAIRAALARSLSLR